MGDAIDIETTRRDIGRDHDVDGAALERRHGAFTLCLDDVAVQGGSGEAARLEFLDQLHRRLLRACEHQHGLEGLGFEDAREGVELVQPGDQPIALAGIRGGRGLVADRDLAR